MSVNQITLIGNIGKEIRKAGNESNPISNFSVATTRETKDRDGNRSTETEWHRVVAFGQPAKFINSYASTGRQIFVQGRLRTRKYSKNGLDCYVTEIVAETVELLGSRPKDSSEREPASHAASAPAASPSTLVSMAPDDDIPF